MRLPTRRGEKEQAILAGPEDQYLTVAKIEQMRRELERLEKTERGQATAEVKRLAEMGDFSENAGYQIAKGTLRRINSRIEILKDRLTTSIPIEQGPSADGKIRIGTKVVLEKDGKLFDFEILGSQETSPSRGRISHLSPLGEALIGHTAGEKISFLGPAGEMIYTVVEVK